MENFDGKGKQYIEIPGESTDDYNPDSPTGLGIDFSYLLLERDRILNGLWTKEYAEKRLNLIKDPEKLESILHKAIDDISSETNYFDVINNEFGLSTESLKILKPGLTYSTKNKTTIKFVQASSHDLERGLHATFDPLKRDIKVYLTYRDRSFDNRTRLQRLLLHGTDIYTESLLHELIHSEQFSANFLVRLVNSFRDKPRLEWLESQAYRGANNNFKEFVPQKSGGFSHQQFYSINAGIGSFSEFVNKTILHQYRLYNIEELNDVNLEDIIVCASLIDKLYALGMSSSEIAKIFMEFYKPIKGYGSVQKIDEFTKGIMNKRGFDEDDVQDLILADRIKKSIGFLKIRKITQGILESGSGDFKE